MVLTAFSQNMKLVRLVSTDTSTVSIHNPKVRTQPRENFSVGTVHLIVRNVGCLLVAIKGIGVFHDELSPTHQSEARSNFVTILRLDLIQGLRQIPIALYVPLNEVSDHFFVRRP